MFFSKLFLLFDRLQKRSKEIVFRVIQRPKEIVDGLIGNFQYFTADWVFFVVPGGFFKSSVDDVGPNSKWSFDIVRYTKSPLSITFPADDVVPSVNPPSNQGFEVKLFLILLLKLNFLYTCDTKFYDLMSETFSFNLVAMTIFLHYKPYHKEVLLQIPASNHCKNDGSADIRM